MPCTAAALYAARLAQARQQLAALSAALDADEARIAERKRSTNRGIDYADAGSMGHVVEKLAELIRFLTA